MIKIKKQGRVKTYSGEKQELFDNFKKELIEVINNLKIEDDPHVMLIEAKGHDDPHYYSTACPGSVLRWGLEMMTHVSPRLAENRQKEEVTQIPMAKGGQA